MSNGFKNVLIFTLGAAAGAVVSWKLLETRFEEKLTETLELEREAFDKRLKLRDEIINSEYSTENASEKVAMIQEKTAELAYDLGYSLEETKNMAGKPHVIPYENFDTLEDYTIDSLTYYEGDGVLSDDFLNPVEDIENTVGLDFASHFGKDEHDPDAIYIRNDRLKTDYEILLDTGKFSDVKGISDEQY